ncbi:MAG: hypothetical protein U9R16_01055 [Campylobacterota bacterium]|nr:hypothetical protein [Campylobacterota bacterium]
MAVENILEGEVSLKVKYLRILLVYLLLWRCLKVLTMQMHQLFWHLLILVYRLQQSRGII